MVEQGEISSIAFWTEDFHFTFNLADKLSGFYFMLLLFYSNLSHKLKNLLVFDIITALFLESLLQGF